MFDSIYTKDLNIGEKYASLFRRNTVKESSIWLKYIYLFTGFFIAIFLLLSITNVIHQTLWVDYIMFGILVMFLFLVELLIISEKSKKRILQEVVVNIIAMGSIALFGVAVGTSSQLLLYALGLFMASIMVIRQPLVTILVYVIIHFLFITTLYLTTRFEGIYLHDQISLLLVLFVAIIASIIRYNFFKKQFLNKIKLQEINTSLKILSSMPFRTFLV